MTKRRRFLPEFTTGFRDRHGKWRYRFRRHGFPGGYYHAPLGTPEFMAEWAAFMAGGSSPASKPERFGPGTVGLLFDRYIAVPARLGPSETTQRKVRQVLQRFVDEFGHDRIADFTFEHIDAILAKRTKKVLVAKRMEGGVEAARKLRKELIRFFDFAIKTRLRTDNPVAQADRIKVTASQRSRGFYSWTEDDIAAYRRRWPLGTRERLAMELLLWTGQRRIDGIWLGPAHIRGDRIEMSQSKTGKDLGLPVAPQLLDAIKAMPAAPAGATHFLLTDAGKPFTNAGFGNWFRERCDLASLPLCTAHGLRKAMMRRLAELGTSQQGIKSVSMHSGDDEVAVYTRAADQRRMADAAIGALSAWEVSNPPQELDTTNPQPTVNRSEK